MKKKTISIKKVIKDHKELMAKIDKLIPVNESIKDKQLSVNVKQLN